MKGAILLLVCLAICANALLMDEATKDKYKVKVLQEGTLGEYPRKGDNV